MKNRINRRAFAVWTLSAIAALTFPMVACNTQTIANFVALIGKYAAQLATYFGASGYAAQITTLAAQIATDIANWQSGSPAADAINALDDLASLVNLIPAAGPYVVFIDLLLGAISGLLALIPQAAAQLSARARTLPPAKVVAPTYYADLSKKSMTTATDNLSAAWARLIIKVGPVTR